MVKSQPSRIVVSVVGCQFPDGKDGDEVFLVWRRGLKEKNSGTTGMPFNESE
jgi:hypothetical protein